MRLPLAITALAISCAPAAPPAAIGGPAPTPAKLTHESLRALFTAEWEYQMREWPTRASLYGDHRYDDRWPDVTPAAYERRAAHDGRLFASLRALDPSALASDDRVSFDLFLRGRELDSEGAPFRLWHLAIDQLGGVQTADEIASALPFATVRDYEAWIARLEALPAYIDATIQLLAEGVKEKIVQPRVIMDRVPAQIGKQVVSDPEQSPFYAPFAKLPASLPQADRDRLVARGRDAVARAVVPAYRRLGEFFERDYLPACFPQVGAWQLPRGGDAYAHLARLHTTTRLTPQQIHDVGLGEVARIRSEMVSLMGTIGFKGTLPELFAWLRTDPRFFQRDPKVLFALYEQTTKRIEPKLPSFFERLPRTGFDVRPVPALVAPDTTTAYYREPAADGSRPGTFFVNLYRPEARPTWEVTALTMHESIPGHHLQIALADELGDLPDFRKHAEWTAFVEGWALYAESLGDEMGLYDDPYARFGRLAYEMWRAVRLVVDTGMHALRWDRARAIQFFLDNAPKTELDVTNEVDRYVAWPGQALAYKIGELEIQRLRRRAQAELGPRFDVREFHDVVLRNGAIPMDTLAQQVEAWLTDKRATDQRGRR
jgi:uncharacterized protein (DUF885 family)